MDSGEIPMQSVISEAAELMTHAADSVRSMADHAHVTIEVLASTASVWGDPDRLVQVLTNLLANAIKFSPATGGTVWLDAERSAGEVVFRVRDEGRGIPTAKLQTVFDRFTQVDESDSREKGGTGLGLAICRSIVAQHGGQIWAESAPGAGTTMFVALRDGGPALAHLLPTHPEADEAA